MSGGLALSNICILVHDSNYWSILCGNDSACCDYGNFIDPMAVNTLYVNASAYLSKDSNVVSSNSTVCTLVNKQTLVSRMTSRDGIGHGSHVSLLVYNTIEVDLLRLGWFAVLVGRL